MKDPFWKRSGFGMVVLYIGTMLIFWLVDDEVPTSQDLIQGLVLVLGLFGYQKVRPTQRHGGGGV